MGLLVMIVGLALFLGAHSVPTLVTTRQSLVGRLGEGGYKGAFTLASIVGIVLIAWGFGLYRQGGYVQLWTPPRGLSHLTVLLMWPALVALFAQRPGEIKRRLKHPMLVGVKIWAFAHLLANGDLGSLILFGSLLAWAVYDRISVKRRQPDAGKDIPPGFGRNDVIAIVAGTVAWGALIKLHPWFIGVPVFQF
ncbi:NnrU family protein [Alsobacter sp. R-9]